MHYPGCMSNVVSKTASREEEIAFLAMEEVLGVEIKLADAGGGDKMPDGVWVYPDVRALRAIVEVTSPPADDQMRSWAKDKIAGRYQTESGSIPLRLNELAQVCAELLEEPWAKANLEKLLSQPADERHLFLFGRTYKDEHYFRRLCGSADSGVGERVDDLVLPDGISDVWFRGGAQRLRNHSSNTTKLWLARFQASTGWHRYVVSIEEQHLPSPNRSIADDPFPKQCRRPKDRRLTPSERQLWFESARQ